MDLHVGQSYTATLLGATGRVPALVSVTVTPPGIVNTPVIVGNKVTWTAVAPGTVTAVYSAVGFKSLTAQIVVPDLEPLVVTDGPATP